MSDARRAAVENILAVLDGRSLDTVLARGAATLNERDRALAAELSYGVCRWYRRLDRLVGTLLHRPLKAKDRDIMVLLLVGAYQLIYSRVPPHAALSATVETSRRLGKGWASKLVNGILRRLQREYPQLAARVDADPAVRHALPDWLYHALDTAWGARCDTVAQALQQRPPMTLRVDTARLGRADYARRLAADGLTGRPHPSVATALTLDQAVAVERLPGFDQGRVSVQDAGAQLAAAYLDLRPGQRVLDACAAPGGKTLAILQRCPELRLTAVDVDPERLRRVEQNLQRGGLDADIQCADAAAAAGQPWARGQFDRILLDAPCSATGVLRRHPDIRLLRRADDVAQLARRQAAMLDAMWALLSPGGRLLYATCSVLPAENSTQIEAFLARHPDAVVAELPTTPGQRSGEGVQLLPGIDETDGFFYAALCKGMPSGVA